MTQILRMKFHSLELDSIPKILKSEPSNEIEDRVRSFHDLRLFSPHRYDAVALAVDLQGRSKAGCGDAKRALIRSRASTRYISVLP